jgi:hypothetical protein
MRLLKIENISEDMGLHHAIPYLKFLCLMIILRRNGYANIFATHMHFQWN